MQTYQLGSRSRRRSDLRGSSTRQSSAFSVSPHPTILPTKPGFTRGRAVEVVISLATAGAVVLSMQTWAVPIADIRWPLRGLVAHHVPLIRHRHPTTNLAWHCVSWGLWTVLTKNVSSHLLLL